MSDRHDTHIDDLFKQKLGNYSVPPPPSSWQQISKVLPQPVPFYQRPRFIATVVGLAMLIGSGIGYLSYQPIQSLINSNNLHLSNQQSPNGTTSSSVINTTQTSNTHNGLLPNMQALPTILNNIPALNKAGNNATPPSDNSNNNSWVPLSQQQNHIEQHTTAQNKTKQGSPVRSKNNNVGIQYLPNQFAANNKFDNTAQTSLNKTTLQTSTSNNTLAQISNLSNNSVIIDNTIQKTIGNATQTADATNQQTTEQASNQALSNNTSITQTDTANTANQLLNSTNIAQTNATNTTTVNEHPKNTETVATTHTNKPSSKRPTIRDKKGRILFPDGLTIGTYYNFNNTWIFSPSALKGEQNLTQQLTFGRAHALSFGYDFNPRFAMSFDWVIKSYQGQVFDYVTHMHIHAKNDVRLTYTHFPLLFKYKFNSYSGVTRQPMVLNCIAGLEYGSLKAAEINVPNRNLQNDILRNHSWGFVLGADYDVYLTDNYYLTFGVRSSLTTGANKGEFILPTNSTTNNLLIGGKLGLNYRFVHK